MQIHEGAWMVGRVQALVDWNLKRQKRSTPSSPSVQFSCSVMSDSLRPHGLQRTRLPCLSSAPGASSNSCPSSQWCHPTVSSSVIPFFSCLQSFPASGSFPVDQFFASGDELELQLQHQSFQWIFRTDFLKNWLVWFPHLPLGSCWSGAWTLQTSLYCWNLTGSVYNW